MRLKRTSCHFIFFKHVQIFSLDPTDKTKYVSVNLEGVHVGSQTSGWKLVNQSGEKLKRFSVRVA